METEKTKLWLYKCLAEDKSDFPSKNLSDRDIEDWTGEFLLDLRAVFEGFVKAFGELKNSDISCFSPSEEVKERLKGSIFLYDLADKKGFMLFKKGYKLIFSYVQPGCVKVQFLRQKPFSETEYFVDAFIKAVAGEALSVRWTHEDHKGFVDINVLARYYMRRFLQEARA